MIFPLKKMQFQKPTENATMKKTLLGDITFSNNSVLAT